MEDFINGDYLNILACSLILLALITARKERRLPLVILSNYAAYGVLAWLSDDYENNVFLGDHEFYGLWYLINALREIVILAFVFEGLLKAQQGRKPYWVYFGVLLISISASLLLALSDVTGKDYLWSIHLQAIYLIPFAEVAVSWWGSDNLFNRRYSTRRQPVPIEKIATSY